MQILEYNNSHAIEIRDDGASLVGLAAVFYREGDPSTEYRPFPGQVERVERGAFRKVIERGDEVWAAVNHNMERIIGRRGANTLVIEEDDLGLRYRADVADTSFGRDLVVQVRRGDFKGSSIGFAVADGGVTRKREGDVTVRTVTEVGFLRDVGPVHTPAFEGTSVSMRSVEILRSEAEHIFRLERHQERQKQLADLKAELKARLA